MITTELLFFSLMEKIIIVALVLGDVYDADSVIFSGDDAMR